MGLLNIGSHRMRGKASSRKNWRKWHLTVDAAIKTTSRRQAGRRLSPPKHAQTDGHLENIVPPAPSLYGRRYKNVCHGEMKSHSYRSLVPNLHPALRLSTRKQAPRLRLSPQHKAEHRRSVDLACLGHGRQWLPAP